MTELESHTTTDDPTKAPDSKGAYSLEKIRQWHQESCRWEATWRPEAEKDEEFYHGKQWSAEEKAKFEEDRRVPMVSNHIQKVVNAMVGFRAQNKQDIAVLPRGQSDNTVADIRTAIIKFLMDSNQGEFALGDAAFNQYVGPLGWLYVGYQNDDPDGEPIAIRRVPWRQMRLDPLAMKDEELDLLNHRFVMREKWVTLEDALLLYPEHKDRIRQYTSVGRDNNRPLALREYSGDAYEQPDANIPYWIDETRQLRLVECWYREKAWGHYLIAPDGTKFEFDPHSEEDQLLALQGYRIEAGILIKVKFCTFTGDLELERGNSPYPHKHFPYLPLWGLVDDNGSPYGAVRSLRDPQKLINFSRSKLIWFGASNQVVMEEGAADEAEVAENAARPDGIIKVRPGAKFEFVNRAEGINLASGLTGEGVNDIREIGGSPEEMRGQESNAKSGRAILARQDAAIRQQGRFIDNEQRAMIRMGYMLNSLIDQTFTAEKVIRVTEASGALNSVAFNVEDPLRVEELKANGVGKIVGSIQQGKFDVAVVTKPVSATHRLAQLETFGELLENLPPEMRAGVADLFVQSTDLPNRDAIAMRIQNMMRAMMPMVMGGDPMMQGQMPMAGEPTQNSQNSQNSPAPTPQDPASMSGLPPSYQVLPDGTVVPPPTNSAA